jgi:hypothetical protein
LISFVTFFKLLLMSCFWWNSSWLKRPIVWH